MEGGKLTGSSLMRKPGNGRVEATRRFYTPKPGSGRVEANGLVPDAEARKLKGRSYTFHSVSLVADI